MLMPTTETFDDIAIGNTKEDVNHRDHMAQHLARRAGKVDPTHRLLKGTEWVDDATMLSRTQADQLDAEQLTRQAA